MRSSGVIQGHFTSFKGDKLNKKIGFSTKFAIVHENNARKSFDDSTRDFKPWPKSNSGPNVNFRLKSRAIVFWRKIKPYEK